MKDEIRGLLEFIDWVLQLSDEEEKLIWEEVKGLEEVDKMPYVMSIERISRAEGLQQGLQQGWLEEGKVMIVEALDERFGKIPQGISNAVNQIKDRDVLKFLLRQVIRCSSIEEFKQVLNRQN
ncbi:MAG: hypothetical protein AAB296_10265 [Candidatus Desantisbacteria bacterium]